MQDPPPSQLAGSSETTANSSVKLGTFRRVLNAIRYCFTKRSRSKKPDWLLDKQPPPSHHHHRHHHHRSRSKSIPSEDVPSDASTANILCSHLSVDPSLPSHYRVCNACISFNARSINWNFIIQSRCFYRLDAYNIYKWYIVQNICSRKTFESHTKNPPRCGFCCSSQIVYIFFYGLFVCLLGFLHDFSIHVSLQIN